MGPQCNPPHPSLTLHLVQGENHATLGVRVTWSAWGPASTVYIPFKHEHMSPEKGTAFVDFIQGKSSSNHPFPGGSWGSYGSKARDPTNHHEFNAQQKHSWLNSHIYQRQIGAERLRHVHVPPVFANIKLSISLMGSLGDDERRRTKTACGIHEKHDIWCIWCSKHGIHPLKCNMTGWKTTI